MLKRGPKWLRDWLNSLLKFAIASRPLRSETVEIHETADGTQLLAGAESPAGSAAVAACQLRAFNASTSEGETLTKKVGFAWGTINGMQPEGFAAGGKPEFTITVSESKYFFAACTFDETTLLPESAEIIAESSPTKTNTATIVYHLIASVMVEGENMTIASSCGPYALDPCALSS